MSRPLLRLCVFALPLLAVLARGFAPWRDAGAVATAKISPELVRELEDFENLIPAVKIDEIVAEHLLTDGNFRHALSYIRSDQFTQLQRQLLDVPEIVEALEFLHMTVNATAAGASLSLNDNGLDKTATNAAASGTGSARYGGQAYLQQPQLEASWPYSQQSLDGGQVEVDIVLLDGSKKHGSASDIIIGNHHQGHWHRPVRSFTSFVEDIIKQLPRTAYRNMIIEKCTRNAKFAAFFAALRSAEFRPLVDALMKSANIVKIMQTLSAHNIDVQALEPIAFEVISWGPPPPSVRE